MRLRRTTTTSNFGVGRREGHDAGPFYARFRAPVVSGDETVLPPDPVAEPFVLGDARSMDTVSDGSVALVVTSPPYFAGKEYEEELDRTGVPSSYLEYLDLLRDVLAESVAKLEPGGRIAVNVANLGRRPYRSLSADVVGILAGDLGLLLRGELIWRKAEGASGSCAWGSYRSAANPVLRDVTERVVVASKGRFDRALGVEARRAAGLPHESTLGADDFMALTLDVWSVPPERAQRVGHPAPFPVELPERIIGLYTYAGDLVLDPFMGSGSALVAAARLGRRYVGYDTDPGYVELARRRVAEEGTPATPVPDGGLPARRLAAEVLAGAGFTVVGTDRRIKGTGVAVSIEATDAEGGTWLVDVAGPNTGHRGGLSQAETVWRTLGRAHALRGRSPRPPLLILTTALPRAGSDGDRALRAAGPEAFFDAVDTHDPAGRARLACYAGGHRDRALPGFWAASDGKR